MQTTSPTDTTAPGDRAPSRRQFVRQFAVGTISAVVGRPWVATLLATLLSPSRASAATDGVLCLKLSDFPALLQNLGSVRVSVNPMGGSYPSGDFYPIIITRSGNQFYALSSACTHRGCVVLPFDGTAVVCPCHGSEFSLDGTVTKPPADTNLTSYDLQYDGENTLQITVPGLGYSISGYNLLAGINQRMRLEFPTFSQVDYEVRFRADATFAWQVVPFATSETGLLDSKVLTGDGTTREVFVARTAPAGFFNVAIIVREV